ncbi:MAG TPA: site-2 protease family protein, partial [Verrucomicrobiae bacterium]|nr:site-2 protease family protein [Verrucomicrobiae bacterium]
GMVTGYASVTSVAIQLAFISLVLCFFNLIPVPPLDGSHLVKNLVGMSYETYWKLSRFGFIAVLILINLPGVQNALTSVILSTEAGLGRLCGIDRDALIKFLAGI